jgi:anti-anti-sigma factor
VAEPIGRVEVEERNGHAVVRIVGDVDISNVEDIEKALEAATNQRRPRHVIDLRGTTYFDSSGIRLLFALATRLQSRRQQLHLIAPPDGMIRRVLELTDLPTLVPLASSMDEIDPRA